MIGCGQFQSHNEKKGGGEVSSSIKRVKEMKSKGSFPQTERKYKQKTMGESNPAELFKPEIRGNTRRIRFLNRTNELL